jgi:hypothetical protein
LIIILYQIDQVILDAMHTIDGNLVPHVLIWMFGLQKQKRKTQSIGKSLHPRHLRAADKFIEMWQSCTPREIARKLRGIADHEHWKSTEGRQMLHYQSIAILYKLGDPAKEFFSVWCYLLVAVKLISGDSVEPVSPEDIERSRQYMNQFFIAFRQKFGPSACSFMLHIATHIPDDVEIMDLHLDAITAYPFEDFMRQIKKVPYSPN